MLLNYANLHNTKEKRCTMWVVAKSPASRYGPLIPTMFPSFMRGARVKMIWNKTKNKQNTTNGILIDAKYS